MNMPVPRTGHEIDILKHSLELYYGLNQANKKIPEQTVCQASRWAPRKQR